MREGRTQRGSNWGLQCLHHVSRPGPHTWRRTVAKFHTTQAGKTNYSCHINSFLSGIWKSGDHHRDLAVTRILGSNPTRGTNVCPRLSAQCWHLRRAYHPRPRNPTRRRKCFQDWVEKIILQKSREHAYTYEFHRFYSAVNEVYFTTRQRHVGGPMTGQTDTLVQHSSAKRLRSFKIQTRVSVHLHPIGPQSPRPHA